MYYLLKSKQFKTARNQKLHLKDSSGVTYCKTENVRRKKDAVFLEFDKPEGRAICKMCMAIRDQVEFGEPDGRVLMGERME